MGNCAGSCTDVKKNKYHFKVDKFDKVPDDTEKYRNLNTIKRPFSALLANVKVKKCPYSSIGVKISIDDHEYYKLGNKSVTDGQDLKWKFEKRLDFMKTDYQIRTSFLVVQLIDETQNIVGSLRINLYLISVGPYHQDFMIEFKNGKIGRISFDFKVSQLIEISLQSLQAQINLFKKHPGQNFVFSIKTIVGNDTKVSKPSYPIQVMLDKKLSNKYLQGEKTPKLPRRRSLNNLVSQQVFLFFIIKKVKQLNQGNNLQWRKSQCQQMPSISMKILFSQLHHAYFQILLIKYTQTISKSQDDNQSDEIIIKQQLFAQCYISFHKLFTKQPQVFMKDGVLYQRRNIQVHQKIQINGRQSGKARLYFYIQNQKYLKQMQVCVRTQQGVSKTSPVFQFDDDGTSQYCKQVKQLKRLNQDIQLMIIKLEQGDDGYFQIRKLKSQIQSHLNDMLPILQKSSKQSMILYSYTNPKQLIQAQKILIGIGQKIANYVQQDDQVIGQLCWLILIALIKRGQFRLSNIGFNQRQRLQIEIHKMSKITKKKVQVAFMFQHLMYKLLKIALQSLNFKGSQTQRAFAQIFCAYAYFRIPDFRNQMLNIILKQGDQDVPQWRGIQFSLNQDVDYTSLRDDVDSFTALFDWERGFHKCLEKTEKPQGKGGDQLELSEILSNENWKHRFEKRGPAFFSFIKYWVSYVQSLVVKSKDIQWKYFPGYNRLLKVFFLQLKRRKITQYPDALKQTGRRLVANQKIFSVIVFIILKKSNIYQPLTVIKSIEMISDLLLTLKSINKKIPALFHYGYFFKAIQCILDSQFLLMLQVTLIMLYTHYDMFHLQFRKNLCAYLLKKVFYKLFFHWSLNVRNVFHHLLIYRISYQINSSLLKQSVSTQIKQNSNQYIESIKQNYKNALQALDNITRQKQLSAQNIIVRNRPIATDKDIHLVMKKKLIQRKLSKAKKQLLQPKHVDELLNEFPQSDNENNQLCLQKRRKQAQTKKPSYEDNLLKPRMDRTQSEIIQKSKIAVIYKNYRLQKKQQEVIQLNKVNSIKIKNEILDTTQVRDDVPSLQNLISRKRTTVNHIFNQFQEDTVEFTPITQAQAHYIGISIASFQEIKQVYSKGILSGRVDAPRIQRQEISLDQREIRPQRIDQW